MQIWLSNNAKENWRASVSINHVVLRTSVSFGQCCGLIEYRLGALKGQDLSDSSVSLLVLALMLDNNMEPLSPVQVDRSSFEENTRPRRIIIGDEVQSALWTRS